MRFDDHRSARRGGVVLAFLALLSQTLIALLPMPAMAATSPFGPSICHLDDTGHQGAAKTGKNAGHANPVCPVCQAAQLLASLVPPTPPLLFEPSAHSDTVDFIAAAPGRISRSSAFHQARAPPPTV